VCVEQGKEFVESPAVDLQLLYEDMSSTIPLVSFSPLVQIR